jgi:hypothetical protein
MLFLSESSHNKLANINKAKKLELCDHFAFDKQFQKRPHGNSPLRFKAIHFIECVLFICKLVIKTQLGIIVIRFKY